MGPSYRVRSKYILSGYGGRQQAFRPIKLALLRHSRLIRYARHIGSAVRPILRSNQYARLDGRLDRLFVQASTRYRYQIGRPAPWTSIAEPSVRRSHQSGSLNNCPKSLLGQFARRDRSSRPMTVDRGIDRASGTPVWQQQRRSVQSKTPDAVRYLGSAVRTSVRQLCRRPVNRFIGPRKTEVALPRTIDTTVAHLESGSTVSGILLRHFVPNFGTAERHFHKKINLRSGSSSPLTFRKKSQNWKKRLD